MASADLPPGLIDTDILIDAERGVRDGVAFVVAQRSAGGPRLSVVSAMELLVGCRDSIELGHVRQFLEHAVVEPIVASISRRAMDAIGSYTLSHGLLIADALIAATALELDMPLYSKNTRHFQMIPGLAVIRPYA